MILAFAIDGYQAIDTSTPRYAGGKLWLRVSDITTLVSVGLVVIKFFVASWSAVAVWRCAYILTHEAESDLSVPQLSFLTRYKLPPWIRYPFRKQNGGRGWLIAVVLLCILPQAFIAPLFSGAVNWNPSSIPAGNTTVVNSTVPTADFNIGWYYYNLQGSFDKKAYLRKAAGYASLTWANSAAVAANGASMTGNGCRHVVNNDGLPINSTLANAIIPCIKIHDITWAMTEDDVPRTISNPIRDSSSLSLVDDNPALYYNPGEAVLFDPDNLWDDKQDKSVPPKPSLFSKTLKLGLMITREDVDVPCKNLSPTVFGDANKWKQYLLPWNRGNCYLVGTVRLTAGVTRSPLSTYISPRVVEDQTPLDEVKFEPNPWVQESLWLMPDLMTMIAVMNSSLLPTWDNVDGYAETLIRQAYLAAWDMYHASFDMDAPGSLFSATAQEPRIQATVSFCTGVRVAGCFVADDGWGRAAVVVGTQGWR